MRASAHRSAGQTGSILRSGRRAVAAAAARAVEPLEQRTLLAAGALDTTFATTGRVIADFGTASDRATDVLVQLDKKVLVAGSFGLARYTAAGALDTSFSGDGKVTGVSFNAIAFQPDGKIITVGDNLIARYNADGALDTSFSGDGKVTPLFPLVDVAVQPDGKIVVGGTSGNNFAVARYTTVGSLDAGFGTVGRFTHDFGLNDTLAGLAIQYDGKIVLGGQADTTYSWYAALVRVNPDGTLDSSYQNGIKENAYISADNGSIDDVAMAPDGKIILAGRNTADAILAVARFTTAGKFDTTFSGDGVLNVPFSGEMMDGSAAWATAVQSDGRIILAGYANAYTTDDLALTRIDTNGSLDGSFGTAGKTVSNFGSDDQALAVALSPDGKIVVAGHSGGDALVARYTGSTITQSAFATAPWALPGTIEIERFDHGGEGYAYHDADRANEDGTYRYSGVDIASTTDASRYAVSHVKSGEWMEYTVNAGSTGKYDITFRVSSSGAGGKFHLEWDGADRTGAITVPDTGGAWQTITKKSISMTSGPHTVRLKFDTNGASGYTGMFNNMAFKRVYLPGDADPAFGGAGLATTDLGGVESIADIAIQTDGKIVAVGGSWLARYTASGSLDTTFSGDGLVNLGSLQANAVAMGFDGKIIVAGQDGNNFGVRRYSSTGSLDAAFGAGGIVTTDFGATDGANAVILQPDGKIIVGGYRYVPSTSDSRFALARYTSAGALDTTFDTDGKLTTSFSYYASVYDLAIQSNGRILAAGSANDQAAVVRYNTSGSLDPSFDGDGKRLVNIVPAETNIDAFHGVLVQRDGRIALAGGTSYTSMGHDLVVMRINSDGTDDAAFGVGGQTRIAGADMARGLVIQSNGKLLTAAEDQIVRFTTAGALDSGFGSAGKRATMVQSNAIALQENGKIVVGGGYSGNFALACYYGDKVSPVSYPGLPVAIPGKIQFENFDEYGHYDSTVGNTGGLYRYTPVDIEACGDTGRGYNVTTTRPSEWLRYTVDVTTAKSYTFGVRVASDGLGGKFHIEVDGVDKTGTMTVPDTGGAQTWQTLTTTGISLSAGKHTIKLVMDGAGPAGTLGNFNWLSIT